jgi:hypothetical protein
MCTAITRRFNVCYNFGTLKKEKLVFYIHQHLTLAHMYSHFIKQLSERRIQMSSWLFTLKKHWHNRSFFTAVSFCNTVLIIKSHENLTHCHNSPPWWLVSKYYDDDDAYVTRNITGFLNGVPKRVRRFRKSVCFHFVVTKVRNRLLISYVTKR